MKKIVSILLIGIMTLSLVACGGSTSSGSSKAGKTITFGTYHNDNLDNKDVQGKPIEWIIVDKNEDENKMLIVSKKILFVMPYSPDGYDRTTWENSGVRKFLNTDFVEQCFTSEEQDRIMHTNINNKNTYEIIESGSGMKDKFFGGNDTIDRVFIFNLEEFNNYLLLKNLSKCEIVDGLSEKLRDHNEDNEYWLRDVEENYTGGVPGPLGRIVSGRTGEFKEDGIHLQRFNWGVRPAMWISY